MSMHIQTTATFLKDKRERQSPRFVPGKAHHFRPPALKRGGSQELHKRDMISAVTAYPEDLERDEDSEQGDAIPLDVQLLPVYYQFTEKLHSTIQAALNCSSDAELVHKLQAVQSEGDRWLLEVRRIVEPVRQSRVETLGVLTALMKHVEELGYETQLSEAAKLRLKKNLKLAQIALAHEKTQDSPEFDCSLCYA